MIFAPPDLTLSKWGFVRGAVRQRALHRERQDAVAETQGGGEVNCNAKRTAETRRAQSCTAAGEETGSEPANDRKQQEMPTRGLFSARTRHSRL